MTNSTVRASALNASAAASRAAAERRAQWLRDRGWHCRPTPVNPDEHRAQVIDGLYALADWLTDHPEVPVPRRPDILYPIGVYMGKGTDEADWSAELARIRRAVGADAVDAPSWEVGGHPSVIVDRGPVRMRWYFVPQPAD